MFFGTVLLLTLAQGDAKHKAERMAEVSAPVTARVTSELDKAVRTAQCSDRTLRRRKIAEILLTFAALGPCAWHIVFSVDSD